MPLVDKALPLEAQGQSNGQGQGQGQTPHKRERGISSRSLTVMRTVDPSDGPIVALEHFTSDIACVVTYATERGAVVGWDIRSLGEAFRYSLRPEFGSPTCMTLPLDNDSGGGSGHCVMVGTSRGYVVLWDKRYSMMCAAWRYSSGGPIHRMAYCRSSSVTWAVEEDDSAYHTVNVDGDLNAEGQRNSRRHERGGDDSRGVYLVVAAGTNETAVWPLPIPHGGECFKCFRSVPIANSRSKVEGSPRLVSVSLPNHPLAPVESVVQNLLSSPSSSPCEPSVRAFLCHISPTVGSSYMITAGTDKNIRYWDWSSPSRCAVLSGLAPAQHKPAFVTNHNLVTGYDVRKSVSPPSPITEIIHGIGTHSVKEYVGEAMTNEKEKERVGQGQGHSRGHNLFVCYDTSPPSQNALLQSQLPVRDGRGTAQPPTTPEVRTQQLSGFKNKLVANSNFLIS